MPKIKHRQMVEYTERRIKLIQYRNEGRPYHEFYKELGYGSVSAASKDFHRILEEQLVQQSAGIEVFRQQEVLRLDEELARLARLYERVEQLLERQNLKVSDGRVITHEGEPLPDDSPFLAAVDRLLKIDDNRRRVAERRAKLMGLDAAQRVEVLTVDALTAEAERLNQQLAALDREAAGAEGDPASAG
jgi:hypothetical protein